jgi:ubiquinone/menaquinone biosynthesis C-methylase UbiE
MKPDSRIPLDEKQFTGSEVAHFYDDHARRFMGPVHRLCAARTAALGLNGKRVLDIGTGTGLLAMEIARSSPACQITGIDISEDMLKIARENSLRQNLTERIAYQQASAEALPFPDNSFDIVISSASLHLWNDPVKIFNEMARVTAPGGYCLVWDNLRVSAINPFLSLAGRLMGMNQDQRRLWIKAVNSSYTAREVKDLLQQSVMKDARVKVHYRLLELAVEWGKPLSIT